MPFGRLRNMNRAYSEAITFRFEIVQRQSVAIRMKPANDVIVCRRAEVDAVIPVMKDCHKFRGRRRMVGSRLPMPVAGHSAAVLQPRAEVYPGKSGGAAHRQPTWQAL